MPLNLCANLSTMFDSDPFEKRLHEAKELGFEFVEAQFLYEHDLTSISKARKETGLKIVLINSPATGILFHPSEKPFGFACVPRHDKVFMDSMNTAVKYAKELDCQKIHVIAGNKFVSPHYCDDVYTEMYISNIRAAADLFKKNDIMALIEPMSFKNAYFLKSFDQAVSIIEAVNCSNVKLLLDVYHWHRLGMDIEHIPNYLKYTGHVQVSQAPHRDEPFRFGRINYNRVFNILKENYSGDIGLEYFPTRNPDRHDWIKLYLNV